MRGKRGVTTWEISKFSQHITSFFNANFLRKICVAQDQRGENHGGLLLRFKECSLSRKNSLAFNVNPVKRFAAAARSNDTKRFCGSEGAQSFVACSFLPRIAAQGSRTAAPVSPGRKLLILASIKKNFPKAAAKSQGCLPSARRCQTSDGESDISLSLASFFAARYAS